MNYHDINPYYRPTPTPDNATDFLIAIARSYAALNARAEARFDEECIRFSRPLDKPPKVNEL